MDFLRKIFGFVKHLRTRPGFDRFLSTWQDEAVNILLELSAVNSNSEFHSWKDQAYARLQKRTGQLQDNWIALLIGLAFEELKARNVKF